MLQQAVQQAEGMSCLFEPPVTIHLAIIIDGTCSALCCVQVTPGEVMPIYSDREFDYVLKKHADQLVVVCASSTDCVPCRNFEPVFDVSTPTFVSKLPLPWPCVSAIFVIVISSAPLLAYSNLYRNDAAGSGHQLLMHDDAVLQLFWSSQLSSGPVDAEVCICVQEGSVPSFLCRIKPDDQVPGSGQAQGGGASPFCLFQRR